ncbi:clustered mitochondria protein homolog isoform X1 [Palaemon carinicauda]|uniref:clustered mitochondria protein homolog isoform X1 n=2 Tax=Palaemon carinicauda TaxID=392227 RepID=UPI0035B6914C
MMALETDIETGPGNEKDATKLTKETVVETTLKEEVNSEEKTDADCNGDNTSEGHEKAETESQEKCEGSKKEGKDAKDTEEDKDKNDNDDDKDKDGLLSQEYGFNIKIKPPAGDAFEIQVSSMELVQEIHQLLMDREDTCHRTCFSLLLNDQTLDNFAELKTIEGLKEGSVIKVREDPYTVREARIHVRHVRDLLKSLDPVDAYNGADCASLSFLNTVAQGDIMEKKRSPVESIDCTPPKYILPGCKERPLVPLQPFAKEQKSPQCLKVLTMSGWNPPPGPRKLHGDLMYLYVVTLEGKHYHITASTWGFYLNLTTEEEFNPKPASPSYLSHSLIELLNILSNAFKRNFANLQKKRTSRHPFERVTTPYQVYAWASPTLEHGIDALRAEDAFSSKLGYEEHIPGQTRDWNEELQTTRELSRRTLPERLLRERAIFKVHSDFVAAATRGAMAVVDGNVMAINPGEDAKMQMFIWNNIFFSLGFDVRDHYKEVGGDAAAHVAPRNDLQGVRVYSAVDLEGLYTLGTVVVDYRGFRVTAQSIIPGILEREQEQSVVYGSIDFGKTVVTHPKYMDLLQKAGQQLKILPHKVLNEKNEEIELCSSVECKGIIGNDGRHYILDLLRTFPPDVNFLDVKGATLGSACKKMGFPITHKHKLATLRQELIDAFVDNRYMMFLKFAALHLQQLSGKKQEVNKVAVLKEKEEPEKDEKEKKDNKEIEAEEAKKIVENVTESIAAEKQVEENTKDIIKKAAVAVGSLKEADFDIRFNPDVFSPGVQHANPQGEQLKKERQLVCDAAEFLVSVQLPSLVHDLTDHAAAPTDGTTLCEALHTRGVNIRYLGKVTSLIAKVSELDYIHTVAVGELIARAVKHIFTSYLQNVETISLSSAVAHFLNCYLSSCNSPHASGKNDELLSKKKKKKHPFSYNNSYNQWSSLSPKTLWTRIKGELKSYYSWMLETDGIDNTVNKYGVQKITLLRSFCMKSGVQLFLRDFTFDSKSQETFHEEDIVNLFPIVKHINPRGTDAFNLYTAGQTKIQQGFLKDGYDLISEALNLLNNVYGAMHPEIAQCLRMLARLNYIMGDYIEAMSFQQKAVLMSERVNGIDHPYTITEYTHLALYCFANQQVSIALKLLYRARYLLLLVHGEIHPEVALVDANIGLILHAVGQYSLSLQFLEKALELNNKFFGDKSLKVALSYHLVARTQSCMGDFRGALKNEKETFTIYKTQLGPEHEKTKEADECLRHLTQQAVVMAKKMSEAFNGRGMLGLPPIQIQPPSMTSVLELLNIINGILYVQITPAEIEKVRLELEKGHAKALKEKAKSEAISGPDQSKESEDRADESDTKTESEESEVSDNASEESEIKIESESKAKTVEAAHEGEVRTEAKENEDAKVEETRQDVSKGKTTSSTELSDRSKREEEEDSASR